MRDSVVHGIDLVDPLDLHQLVMDQLSPRAAKPLQTRSGRGRCRTVPLCNLSGCGLPARSAPSILLKIVGSLPRQVDRGERSTGGKGRATPRTVYLAGFRTNSQNPRGFTIGNGAVLAISKRSRSPVTNTSHRPSIADARTQAASGSRMGSAEGCVGFATISWLRSRSRMSFVVLAGNLKRLVSTSRNSMRITSPVINCCAAKTYRTRSAQSPRVVTAAAKTFVSRTTLTKHHASRPRRSDGSVTSRRGTGMLLDVSCCLSMNCQRPRVERSGSKAAILPGA